MIVWVQMVVSVSVIYPHVLTGSCCLASQEDYYPRQRPKFKMGMLWLLHHHKLEELNRCWLRTICTVFEIWVDKEIDTKNWHGKDTYRYGINKWQNLVTWIRNKSERLLRVYIIKTVIMVMQIIDRDIDSGDSVKWEKDNFV